MRYTVLTSRTFHHRITRYLGVLVGAALVATLLLPSAVQAQTTGLPSAEYMDADDSFTVTTPHAALGGDERWVLEINAPNVAANAKMLLESMGKGDIFEVQAKGADGNWLFRIGSGTIIDDEDGATTDGDSVDEVKINNQGPWLTYRHGRPEAPADFEYASRPGAGVYIFTWTDESDTTSVKGLSTKEGPYAIRWTDGDPLLVTTKWKSGSIADKGFYQLTSAETKALKDGEMYTFELTVTGESSSVTKQLTSAAASVMVPIGMVPTPTLPETAALLLGLLLLGSGAYLLRRRQSGGLTPA